MTVQNYTVEYYASATWTSLTNVQQITFNIGRQRQLDQYNASTASVVIRYPTGYATPITALVPGTLFRIKNSGTNDLVYFGKINNSEVTYGKPYAAGVGAADYLTITAESGFAEFGRVTGNGYSMAAGTLSTIQATIYDQTLLVLFGLLGDPSRVIGASTVNGTWADYINQIALTVNARLNDVYASLTSVYPTTRMLSPFYLNDALTVEMSDTTNDSTHQIYDDIQFASYADNYYTQVSVDPAAFSPQIVSEGAGPYRTYAVNTISNSASEALSYAQYLLNNYKTPQVAITSLSCLANAQNSMQLDRLGMVDPYLYCGDQIGRTLKVAFRGTTYECVIEGYSFTATPGQARYTFYVSPASLNAFLILNNATFGRLDFNKLGY